MLGITDLTWYPVFSPFKLARAYFQSQLQKLRTPIPAYAGAAAALCEEFGPPTKRELFSWPIMFPDHERLWWNFGELEILFYIRDLHWNSVEAISLEFIRTDRARHYAGWDPRKDA